MSRLPVTNTNDDSLLRSLYASGGMHFLILLFLYFGLPHFMKPLPAPSVPIPIDIVDVADLTNTRVQEQQEAPKPPQEQPKPEPQKQVTAYQPPTPAAPPTPPEPPKPQEQPQTEALLPPPPKPEMKPKPPPPKPEEKPQADPLASVLKNVKKIQPAEKTPPQPDVKSQTKAEVQPKSMAPSLSNRLTISEEDMVRRQIESHWNVPIGARDIQNMQVDVSIIVNSDRSVQSVDVVDKARMATDPYFRAMAESVIRAIYQSSPLELPEDKYEQWKGITMTFSARDML
jgi:outer membrane biosynthesis protein TonB